MRTLFICLFVLFGIVLSSGCAEKRPPGFPNIVPFVLQVTQNGQPLEGATVSLIPIETEEKANWVIGATTDAKGNAVLRTYGRYVGAPIGRFKVLVAKQTSEGMEEYMAAMDRHDYAAARKIDVKVFSCVEDKYGQAETTPLEIEITKGLKNLSVDAGTPVQIRREFLR